MLNQHQLPIIKLFALEGAQQSPLNPDRGDNKNIYRHGEFIYKVYFYDELLENQQKLLNIANEQAVLKLAAEKESQHLANLKGVYLGRNHVAFKLEVFETDFRDYLEEVRDVRHLPKIFQMIVLGLRELHDLRYVHRDLKPDNIMINLKPLKVVLIDFERASLRT